MEEEIWKPVEEVPKKYLVSNFGRIKYIGGYRNKPNRVTLGVKDKSGYYRINMWDSERKIYVSASVHRLVARAFIDNPNNYPIINHKDENPSNNRADNLEWCTYKYNNEYGTAQKRACNTRIKNKICKKVFAYSLDGVLLNTFNSINDAARFYNTDAANIGACCNNKGHNKTIKNMIFRFEGDSPEYEISKYSITFGIFLQDKLVYIAKGGTQASKFLNISRSTMNGKLRRFRKQNKPMIHNEYRIVILKEKEIKKAV